MSHNVYIYIFIMFAVTYAIRVLPLTLFNRKIKNRFIRSFLCYVPSVTLAVMTFPSMIHASDNMTAGIIALVVGIATAWLDLGLLRVAAACCAAVFVAELVIPML